MLEKNKALLSTCFLTNERTSPIKHYEISALK